MIMAILANIHPGLLEFYFVSIINYIFDYPLTVPGKFFAILFKKKKNNSKNKSFAVIQTRVKWCW